MASEDVLERARKRVCIREDDELVSIFWRLEVAPDDVYEIPDVPRARAALLAPLNGVLREDAGFGGRALMTIPAGISEQFIAVSNDVDRDHPPGAARNDLTSEHSRISTIRDMLEMLLDCRIGSACGVLVMLLMEDYLQSADLRREWMRAAERMWGIVADNVEGLITSGYIDALERFSDIINVCLRMYLGGHEEHIARDTLLALVRVHENYSLGIESQIVSSTSRGWPSVPFVGEDAMQLGLDTIFRHGCCPFEYHRLALITGDLMWTSRAAIGRVIDPMLHIGVFCVSRPTMKPVSPCCGSYMVTSPVTEDVCMAMTNTFNTRTRYTGKFGYVNKVSSPVFSGKFAPLDWLEEVIHQHTKTAVIAGGAVTAAVHRVWDKVVPDRDGWPGRVWEAGDVDIFLFGPEDEQAKTLVSLLAHVVKRHPDARCHNTTTVATIEITGAEPKICGLKMTWPPDAVVVQIVSTACPSAYAVLLNFDQTYLQWGYDGMCVFGTLEAWMGFGGANWYTGSQTMTATMKQRAQAAVARGMAYPRESLFLGTRSLGTLGYPGQAEVVADRTDLGRDDPECPFLSAAQENAGRHREVPDVGDEEEYYNLTSVAPLEMLCGFKRYNTIREHTSRDLTCTVACDDVYRVALDDDIFRTAQIDLGIVVHVDAQSFGELVCVYLDVGEKGARAFNACMSYVDAGDDDAWNWANETLEWLASWRYANTCAGRPRHIVASGDGIAPVYLHGPIEWHGHGSVRPQIMCPWVRETDGVPMVCDTMRRGTVLQVAGGFTKGRFGGTVAARLFVATAMRKAGDMSDDRLAALIRTRRALEK